MVVHYRNQKYSKLKRDAEQVGPDNLFTDPEFPPTMASLFLSGSSDKEIVWKRPRVCMCSSTFLFFTFSFFPEGQDWTGNTMWLVLLSPLLSGGGIPGENPCEKPSLGSSWWDSNLWPLTPQSSAYLFAASACVLGSDFSKDTFKKHHLQWLVYTLKACNSGLEVTFKLRLLNYFLKRTLLLLYS